MPDDDLLVGEITGYRVFHLRGEVLHSIGVTGSPPWLPGTNEAVCLSGKKIVKALKNGPDGVILVPFLAGHGFIPDPNCDCGFWMFKTLAAAMKKAGIKGKGRAPSPSTPAGIGSTSASQGFASGGPATRQMTVVAAVKGWGRYVEGTEGWRTEFAKVVGIYDTHPGIAAAASYYNAEVLPALEIAAEPRTKITGVIEAISKPVMGSTGHYRPITVTLKTEPTGTQNEVFKVWHTTAQGVAAVRAGVGATVEVTWTVSVYQSRSEKMLESIRVLPALEVEVNITGSKSMDADVRMLEEMLSLKTPDQVRAEEGLPLTVEMENKSRDELREEVAKKPWDGVDKDRLTTNEGSSSDQGHLPGRGGRAIDRRQG